MTDTYIYVFACVFTVCVVPVCLLYVWCLCACVCVYAADATIRMHYTWNTVLGDNLRINVMFESNSTCMFPPSISFPL